MRPLRVSDDVSFCFIYTPSFRYRCIALCKSGSCKLRLVLVFRGKNYKGFTSDDLFFKIWAHFAYPRGKNNTVFPSQQNQELQDVLRKCHKRKGNDIYVYTKSDNGSPNHDAHACLSQGWYLTKKDKSYAPALEVTSTLRPTRQLGHFLP